ncbi:MAG: ATP-binding protein [Desulfovibrionaceae bacterium]|nr:ATP-binding protein [Desulfovibrionaceae bacterium]
MTFQEQMPLSVFAPLWKAFPYLQGCFSPWQGHSLGDIAASSYGTAANKTQRTASQAVIDCMTAHTSTVLGTKAAAALGQSLHINNAVLSANLHALDCLPEMAQAIHAFALDRLALGQAGTVIPVLSCGGVSLQSQAYPRGLQSFRGDKPMRFPLFGSAWQNKVELNTPALTAQNLHDCAARWGATLPYEQRALEALLAQLLEPDSLKQTRFGDQITRANAWLCRQRFPDTQPLVVYLELEEIARQLLVRDLARPTSLIYRILFMPTVRRAVLHGLADVRGCWSKQTAAGAACSRTHSTGTVFFWAIDAKGRRCAMQLEEGRTAALLCPAMRLPFTPEALIQALQERRIYPGLFIAYMSLVYEHGLRCHGGIFLVHYLHTMLHCVHSVFTEHNEPLPPLPEPTALAAFALTVQTATEQGLAPSGALEMLAAGGLCHAQVQTMANTKLEDILPLSLASWALEYCPAARSTAWGQELQKASQHWKGIVIHP